MMRRVLSVVVSLSACVLTGCSGAPALDMNQVLTAYYTQDRTYNPVTITNVGQIIAAEGQAMSITVQGTLEPLSVRSNTPGTAEKSIDALRQIGTAAAAGYFAHKSIESLSTTRNPVIVSEGQVVSQ